MKGCEKVGKNIAAVSKECVACGVCVKECPIGAITIFKGKRAVVNRDKCIGCGKCASACPAGVIAVVRKEAERNDKEAMV